MENINKLRRIGSRTLVEEQIDLVKLAVELDPHDSKDVWRHFGNENPESLPELSLPEFLSQVKRRVRNGKGGCGNG